MQTSFRRSRQKKPPTYPFIASNRFKEHPHRKPLPTSAKRRQPGRTDPQCGPIQSPEPLEAATVNDRGGGFYRAIRTSARTFCTDRKLTQRKPPRSSRSKHKPRRPLKSI